MSQIEFFSHEEHAPFYDREGRSVGFYWGSLRVLFRGESDPDIDDRYDSQGHRKPSMFL